MEFRGIFSFLNILNEAGLDSADIGRELVVIDKNIMYAYYLRESERSYSRYDIDLKTGEILNTGCEWNNKLISRVIKSKILSVKFEKGEKSNLEMLSESDAVKARKQIERSSLVCGDDYFFFGPQDGGDYYQAEPLK